MSNEGSGDGENSGVAGDHDSPTIFINYRRSDSAGDARLLYERLSRQFGADGVFLDVVNLQPGMNWLQEISSAAFASVFIVLIGPNWISATTERTRAIVLAPEEDIVRKEIAFALRGSGLRVLPVLVDGAVMPAAHELPQSIRRLAAVQAVQLRHTQFEQDLQHLIAVIEQMGQTPPPAPEPHPIEAAITAADRGDDLPSPITGAPDARHYARIVRHMVDEGTLVILLGSQVNGPYAEDGQHEHAPRLPDSGELAADLARRFQLQDTPQDLAAIAQQVYITSGKPDLYRTLRLLLPAEARPSPLHRFLAGLPGELERLGRTKRFQLIVTTNYDNALEQAFDAVGEPYDVAIYMASGPDKGRFVHLPYEGQPEPVSIANRYAKFPIDDYGELTQTVILKVHGAVDGGTDDYRWRENYVITEDQYIDYLSRSPIESLLPVQILDKLTGSHWLFLGYTMRDWNLRVFLNRIWKGEPLGARSWATESDPDEFDKELWSHIGVELFACPPVDYLAGLSRHLSNDSR
jgi:SIR2-like domain/TIR domain